MPVRMRSLHRPLRRFAQVDRNRRWLVVEAVACLLAARLALIVVAFPRLARRLGTFVPPGDPRVLRARQAGAGAEVRLATEIGWAVTRAARHVPFRAVCLPQAMAAQFMLRRRGIASVMHFGAARGDDKPLDGHAWLDAAGVEVTGYPVDARFAEIACFV